MSNEKCFHCGNVIEQGTTVFFDEKLFCCSGCKTVYEIFSENNLTCYYDFQASPGATPQDIKGKYEFLDQDEISAKLLDFKEDTTHIVSLYIPHIHCSSCIWILENLQQLHQGIASSQVNFPEKKVRITFDPLKVSLKEVVYLLSSIGYEPYVSLENMDVANKTVDRSLIYKIGVAFFCFGNIMLLSFPEYFEVEEFWINQYRSFFRSLIFALALPTFFYAASDYYVSAWKSIKSGILSIDVPITLGIIIMFVRSAVDMIFQYGPGFFDSMAGLIFFMLLGKLFQQKTYSFLSFERDYKSYFPIAVTKIVNGLETHIQIFDIEKGNRLLIRNQELIPVDGILISKEATIDYSFVTGEDIPIQKKSGDKIYAGGKQVGQVIEMEVLHSVSQSYLTQLWSNDIFQKKHTEKYKTITDSISKYFTPLLFVVAIGAATFWAFSDWNIAFNVFTAVLIVACPCALALTAPFTLGNVLRIIGKRKMYLKNATVIEQIAAIDTLVFDKTGTLTSQKQSAIKFEGFMNLTEWQVVKQAVRGSNHPLSRKIYDFIAAGDVMTNSLSDFEEISGKGIKVIHEGQTIKIGSANFLEISDLNYDLQTRIFISFNNELKGHFLFHNQYREGLPKLFDDLQKNYKVIILSGDNEGERPFLEKVLPEGIQMIFNQKPDQKLAYIDKLQKEGHNVMMIGDGLNDAGALAQSNVGVAVAENVNVFSPACDGIIDASIVKKLPSYLKYTKDAMRTIQWSFILSLIYNTVGLAFAVSGNLSPLVAAIIMPLSTITIVSFVTIMTNYFARINKLFNL
jgi:Cu+-exporting ATPase